MKSQYFHLKMHKCQTRSELLSVQLNGLICRWIEAFTYFLAKNVDFLSEKTKTAMKICSRNDYGMNYYVSDGFVNVTSQPHWQFLSFVQQLYISLSWISIRYNQITTQLLCIWMPSIWLFYSLKLCRIVINIIIYNG